MENDTDTVFWAANVPDREHWRQEDSHSSECYRTVIWYLTGTLWRYIFPIGNMNTQSPQQLGSAIRARRRQLKATQKDLALTCGTGLRFISDLEKGKPTCQIGKVLQVLQALGLKLQIASDDGDMDQGEKS